MCADAGLIGFSVQGASMLDFPDRPVATLGSPPMSFAFPASRRPHVVADFSTRFFSEEDMDLFDRLPGVFFKGLGLVLTSKLLGGSLVGQMLEEGRRYQKTYPSHAGGGTIVVIDPGAFVPREAFYEDVDRFHDDIERQMRPMPGYDRPQLPGAMESELAERYRREGIPISTEIVARVEPVAKELQVPCPWNRPTV
jgi:LDH2 family malate/lactate/ureidoglycolate dehydrogenase